MKTYIKILLLVVVVFALALPMLMTGADGRPVMGLSDWLPDSAGWKRITGRVSSLLGQGGDHFDQSVEQLSQQQKSGSSGSVKSNAVEDARRVADYANSPTVLSSSSGKMYKWQDERGKWHFSSEKPTEATQVSLEHLPEVENVMEAPVNTGDNSSTIGFPSFDNAGDLLKKVQRMTEDRQ
jgi:Domain of unknown function (DUF4124)